MRRAFSFSSIFFFILIVDNARGPQYMAHGWPGPNQCLIDPLSGGGDINNG